LIAWIAPGPFPQLRRLGIVLAAAIPLSGAAAVPLQQTPAKPRVTVYKSPTCGCCSKWVDHMRAHGFDVKAMDVENINDVKRKNGVPQALSSCHTSLVNGYVLEGHVPADVVSRLIRERPKVAGLAVREMPIGSPGMEVEGRKDSYAIETFDKAGQSAVYERR
jgi:hypothetical protein